MNMDTEGNSGIASRLTKIVCLLCCLAAFMLAVQCSDSDKVTDPPQKSTPIDISIYPHDGQVEVKVTTSVWISFARPVDCATVSSTALSISDGPVGETTCNFDTLRLTCDSPLDYGTTYTVTVDTSLRFSDGSALDDPFEWTFKTRAMPGAEWESYELDVHGYPGLTGAAYGSSTYILIDQNGHIVRSGNGVNWEAPRKLKPNARFYGIDYLNGVFLVAGTQPILMVSSDGIAWDIPMPDYEPGRSLTDVTFAENRFVAVGGHKLKDGKRYLVDVRTSEDGLHWENLEQNVEGRFQSIEYHNGLYAVVGEIVHPDSGVAGIWTSDNLFDWDLRDFGANASGFLNLAGSPEGLLATGIGAPGRVLTSADGTAWSEHFAGSGFTVFDLFWTGSNFIAAGPDGVIFHSRDGTEWSNIDVPSEVVLRGIWGSPDLLIAVGGRQVFIAR